MFRVYKDLKDHIRILFNKTVDTNLSGHGFEFISSNILQKYCIFLIVFVIKMGFQCWSENFKSNNKPTLFCFS